MIKYLISSLILLFLTTNSSLAEKYSCSQIRGAVKSLGAEVVIRLAEAKGATREQINAVIAKCRLNK